MPAWARAGNQLPEFTHLATGQDEADPMDGEIEVTRCGLLPTANYEKSELHPDEIFRKCEKCFKPKR